MEFGTVVLWYAGITFAALYLFLFPGATRWLMLCVILTFTTIEFVLYLSLRYLIFLLERFRNTARSNADLRRAVRAGTGCESFSDWRARALELDAADGRDKWKEADGGEYNAPLVRALVADLHECMRRVENAYTELAAATAAEAGSGETSALPPHPKSSAGRGASSSSDSDADNDIGHDNGYGHGGDHADDHADTMSDLDCSTASFGGSSHAGGRRCSPSSHRPSATTTAQAPSSAAAAVAAAVAAAHGAAGTRTGAGAGQLSDGSDDDDDIDDGHDETYDTAAASEIDTDSDVDQHSGTGHSLSVTLVGPGAGSGSFGGAGAAIGAAGSSVRRRGSPPPSHTRALAHKHAHGAGACTGMHAGAGASPRGYADASDVAGFGTLMSLPSAASLPAGLAISSPSSSSSSFASAVTATTAAPAPAEEAGPSAIAGGAPDQLPLSLTGPALGRGDRGRSDSGERAQEPALARIALRIADAAIADSSSAGDELTVLPPPSLLSCLLSPGGAIASAPAATARTSSLMVASVPGAAAAGRTPVPPPATERAGTAVRAAPHSDGLQQQEQQQQPPASAPASLALTTGITPPASAHALAPTPASAFGPTLETSAPAAVALSDDSLELASAFTSPSSSFASALGVTSSATGIGADTCAESAAGVAVTPAAPGLGTASALSRARAALSSSLRDLHTLLHLALRHNVGGIMNERLYSHTNTGTKRPVEALVTAVAAAVRLYARAPLLSARRRLRALSALKRSHGHTALCLSGGGGLGQYHTGVVRALLEQGLLPTVISGTSAGALVAAHVCCRTDEELRGSLTPEQLTPYMSFDNGLTWGQKAMAWLKHGHMFDTDQWQRLVDWHTMGGLTFEEAYRRTGRTLVITATSTHAHEPPLLLSRLTSPRVLISSAIIASASVPGLLPLATLRERGADGVVRACRAPYVDLRDGSFKSDIPMAGLSFYFNVNYFIVSQVNPHIAPFFFFSQGDAGRGVGRWAGWRGGYVLAFLEALLKHDMRKNFAVMRDLGMLPTVMGADWSFLFLQSFEGHVTLVPPIRLRDYVYLLDAPTPEDMAHFLHSGRLMVWRKTALLHTRMSLGRALAEEMERLRAQVVPAPVQTQVPAPAKVV